MLEEEPQSRLITRAVGNFCDRSDLLRAWAEILANIDAPGPKGFDPAGPEAPNQHQNDASGPKAEHNCQNWTDPDADQGVYHTQSDQQKKLNKGHRVFVADRPHVFVV